MCKYSLQVIRVILEDIITRPEERWKALTVRDGEGMTPVHAAANPTRGSHEVSTYTC